jgi:hypothetical protein
VSKPPAEIATSTIVPTVSSGALSCIDVSELSLLHAERANAVATTSEVNMPLRITFIYSPLKLGLTLVMKVVQL